MSLNLKYVIDICVNYFFVLFCFLNYNKIKRTFAQSESCEDLTLFLCTSGECISKEFLCDGSKECIDGSDETQDLCKYRSCSKSLDYINEDASDILSIQPSSTEQTFRCNYGACISRFFLCDGIKHCVADGSDETEELCKSQNCHSRQFQCKYGACINRRNACDNRYHCYDGSDETVEACRWRRKQCIASRFFKCKYGACVNRKFKCNAVIDCLDESDESEDICGPRPNLVLRSSLPIPSNPLLIKTDKKNVSTTTARPTVTSSVISRSDIKGCEQTEDQNIYLEILSCGEESNCDGQILPVGTLMLIFCDGSPLPLRCKNDYLWHFERDPSRTPIKKPCIDSGKPSGGSEVHADVRHILPTLPCGILPPFSPVPWLVGLFRSGEFSCTGTIIGPSLVLTAGHCVLENQASSKRIVKAKVLKIQFNSENPNDPQQFASVSSIVLHPQYSGGQSPRNDLALLFLKKNLEKEHGLSSACLDKEGTLLNIDAFTFNRTFGQSLYKWETFKQTLDTSCFNLATMCSRHLNIGKNQFCAINADSTLYLHQGSSGGPYMITTKESREKWAVAGVVSNSIYTTECGTPHTVFSSVSKHYDWIFNCGFHGKCSK
ncbi:UNVERIFIED_CONTAM: hypothetical protein RMT77_006123 [Armadillidium vulgare]